MSEYRLARDEQETFVSQSAQDRIEGTWTMYSDDPVGVRRIEKLVEQAEARGEDVDVERTQHGLLATFRGDCLTVSVRLKRIVSDEERERMRQRARENLT